MTDLTLRQIDKIRALLAEAIENGGMRALDRDTVTAALRDLYDEVLAMPATTYAPATDTVFSAVSENEGDGVSADTEDSDEQAEKEPTERNARLAEVTVPWADTTPAETDPVAEPENTESETAETPEETATAESPEETDSVTETTVSNSATIEETDTVEIAETPTDEETAEDEEYREAEELPEETVEIVEEPAEDTAEETVITAEPEEADDETHDPVEEITLSAEPILPEPTRLERMLADERSLAARLGKERLEAVAYELCYGDTETCLDMIEALEATGDFDMAVLYIQEHYPQKSDSRAIDMLVEVLSAKFI